MAAGLDINAELIFAKEETLTVETRLLGMNPYVLVESDMSLTEMTITIGGAAGATDEQKANYLRLVSSVLSRAVAALPDEITACSIQA